MHGKSFNKNINAKKFIENKIGEFLAENPQSDIQIQNSNEKWLTTEEAAEYLRTSPGSLRNMISNGVLKPSGKFGRLNRFLVSDLRKLLLAKR